MNKLIRKLSDQARFVSEPEYPDQDIIFEKFAKLIVRECVDRIKRVGILEDIEIESDMIADAIKETFGVE